MKQKISKNVLAMATPDAVNWNRLTEAFHSQKREQVTGVPFDCGGNERGLFFVGEFKELNGRILGTLTPEQRTEGDGKKILVGERFLNLRKTRWMEPRNRRVA